MALKILRPGLASQVTTAGQSVQVCSTSMGEFGGVIINPLSASDQGISVAEPLFINLLGPADLVRATGTSRLYPGQWFLVPPQTNAWVNAQTSGHKFTSFFTTFYTPPLPEPVPGQPGTGLPAFGAEPGAAPFPPRSVTGMTTVIPSYLYQQYTDDDDLQGWCQAENEAQQDYVDTFNALNLPIYPGPIVEGKLLDWVARGVYGMSRPSIGSGYANIFGPLNTYGPNWLVPMWEAPIDPNIDSEFGLNMIGLYGPFNVVLANDDIYRRCLTWHFYKGDGNYFSTRWLKRRVWRFLYCINGTSTDFAVDPNTGKEHKSGPESFFADADDAFIADNRQISVTIGVNRNVTIRFVLGDRTVLGGALPNFLGCNGFNPAWGVVPPWNIGEETKAGVAMNDLETSYVRYPPLPFMKIFKDALDLGVLEVPYQFNFTCVIG